MLANLAYAGLSRKKQKKRNQKKRNQKNLMGGTPFPAQKLLNMNIFT